MQSPSDKTSRYYSGFRTPNRNYDLVITKYTCNKFGLAELLVSQYDNLYIPANATVLDVGSGVGPISIFLADQYDCNVSAAEINPIAHKCCVENIQKYNLEHKITPLNIDFSIAIQALPVSSYDLIVANPPISPPLIERGNQPRYIEYSAKNIDFCSYSFFTNSWRDTKGADLADHIFQFSEQRLSASGHIVLVCCDVEFECKTYMEDKLKQHGLFLKKYIRQKISPESIGAETFLNHSIESHVFLITREGAHEY